MSRLEPRMRGPHIIPSILGKCGVPISKILAGESSPFRREEESFATVVGSHLMYKIRSGVVVAEGR
jgi:hypothetical protein